MAVSQVYQPHVPTFVDLPELVTDGIITLAYGKPGTGKSEFLASAGEGSAFLSIGGGHITLQSPGYKKRNPVPPKVHIIKEELDPKTGLFKTADAFDKVTDTMDWFLESDFKTLAIDDATFFNKFARNKGAEANKDNTNASMTTSKKLGFLVVDITDYNKEMNIIDWFFTMYTPLFREKGKNLLMAAHETQYHSSLQTSR